MGRNLRIKERMKNLVRWLQTYATVRFKLVFKFCNALSFYVTKTVLVGPKWFWSDQIDLDLTIMIWLRPKWNDQVQIVILYQNESPFGPNQFILVVTISFWSWPNHYGQVQINLVTPKPFWTNQNCFGHTEGQGIRVHSRFEFQIWRQN